MANEPSAAPSVALRQIAVDAPNYTGYRALNESQQEIRVLDLGPDLTCTLRHVSLTSSPVYYALSYYWGPSGSTKPLTIKSEYTQAEVVHIRKTLAKFLRSLYRQYGTITVWLDVLCINQRSVTEQNAQVAMMGDIYRLAQAVYAWVGPWDPDIEYCFRYTAATTSEQPTSEYDLAKVAGGTESLFARRYWTRYATGHSASNDAHPRQALDHSRVCYKSKARSRLRRPLHRLGTHRDYCNTVVSGGV